MTRTALLVIDMLNEYLHTHGLVFCESCRDIIPTVARCIDFARAHGIAVVYVNTALDSEQDPLASRWGLHAVAGSWGARVVEELRPRADETVVVKKGYDGFFETDLHRELAAARVTDVVLTGIHTHVCVLLTAVGAFQRGYAVTTLADGITTGYRPNHDSRLRFLRTHVGELCDSAEWMTRFPGPASPPGTTP